MTKSRRNQRLIGEAKNVTYTVATVATQSTDATFTVNIPGAVIGDVVMVTPATPTAKMIFDGYVSAPSTITVRLTNAGASGTTVTATTISVMACRLF